MKYLTDVVIVLVANKALTVYLFCNLHIVSYFSNPISVLASISDFHDFFQPKFCWRLSRLFVCFFILLSIQHAFVIVNYFIDVVIVVVIVHSLRNVQRRTHIRKIVSILLYVLLFVSSSISTFELTNLLVHFDDIYYESFTNISH
jgi:hypothetical protein